MKTGRPSTKKKVLDIGDVDDGLVQVPAWVSRDTRTRIKQKALDECTSAKDLITTALEREFGK